MASIDFTNTALNGSLQQLLMADDLQPGSDLSYQLAKTIYAYHPFGRRMVDGPLSLAMSKPRTVAVPESPEDVVTRAFEAEWRAIKADYYIENTMRLAMIYGIATCAMSCEEISDSDPIPPEQLHHLDLNFRVYDPLNTSGSLVLDQNPKSPTFQKPVFVRVSGEVFHPSRTCVVMNEAPIYLEWTNSAFGYVGRSIYQRALYPLKSFVSSMVADDMVSRKCGVLVAKIKQSGSIVNNVMTTTFGQKRDVVKESETNNVISISPEEDIESLNLQGIDSALTTARRNIIANIATAANMPEQLLTQENFAQGFGEGSEDKKSVADYINAVRNQMNDLYSFFTKIVQRKAWNPNFYLTIQQLHPDLYGSMPYDTAFNNWKNSFTATFPELIEERDEKKLDQEKLKTETIVSMLNAMMPSLDPTNAAILLQWAADNTNELALMFPNELQFDQQAFVDNAAQQQAREDQMAQQKQQNGMFGQDQPENMGDEPDVASDAFVSGAMGNAMIYKGREEDMILPQGGEPTYVWK